MQLDSYTTCPCGSGKKIKFCCSKDLLHELDKILRALSGEQYISALDQTAKLISERGPRAALLAIQAETQIALQQLPEAEQTAHKLLEIMPHSSVGLAILAISSVVNGKVDDAVKHLQHSIENVEHSMSGVTASAMSIVAQALLQAGKVLAARGHLLMRAGLTGGEDREAVESLLELNRIDRLPTMLKQDFQYGECLPDAPWHGEFEAAMKSARRGAWLAACESLESLDQKVPYQQGVVRNIAILRGWLGQDPEACAAWRQYTSLPAISEDEAVETEAVCQLLIRPDSVEFMDSLRISHPIRNIEQLMEVLLSDKRVETVPVDPQEVVEEGQPPPKGVFKLLDRPMPASHVGLEYGDLPMVLGDIIVFGKQTDREARLEFEVERSNRFDEAKSKLMEVAGEWIQSPAKEEVQGQVSALQAALNPEVRFPRDITPEHAVPLLNAQRDSIYASVWPDLPRSIFDGKSAREAARDRVLRIRVMAAILNLELATEEQAVKDGFDFNNLRRELGLPTRGTYRIQGEQLLSVPVSRWARVEFAELSDDELLDAFRLITLKNLRSAMRRCANELVARASIAEKIDLAEVYRLLVTVSADAEEALQHIDSGRRITVTKGRSPASWYLLELQVRLSRYEAEECNRLTKLLTTRHSNEPGIKEGLYQVLVRYGVISPDGQVRSRAPDSAAPLEATTASATPESPGLWTPDSAAPKQESKLWLPGMQ